MRKAKGSSSLDKKVKEKGGTIHFLPSPDLTARIAKGDPPSAAEIEAAARSVSEAIGRHEHGKGQRIKKL